MIGARNASMYKGISEIIVSLVMGCTRSHAARNQHIADTMLTVQSIDYKIMIPQQYGVVSIDPKGVVNEAKYLVIVIQIKTSSVNMIRHIVSHIPHSNNNRIATIGSSAALVSALQQRGSSVSNGWYCIHHLLASSPSTCSSLLPLLSRLYIHTTTLSVCFVFFPSPLCGIFLFVFFFLDSLSVCCSVGLDCSRFGRFGAASPPIVVFGDKETYTKPSGK